MTDLDHAILAAADLPANQRTMAAADLGLSSPAMHQRMLALLRTEEAEAVYPALVHRWRRIMDGRRQARGRL